MAYSGLFRHNENSLRLLHFQNLAMFQSLAYLEPKAYLKPIKLGPGILRTLP